jgi:F-type H+-transporting ATPase subunit gamma
MAVNTKIIKTRIKSVKNTKKITKAMEMVSASKMRKAVDAALGTRMYAQLAKELLEHLAHIDEPNYPLLEKRSVKNILMVLVSSNRGLCGSFNSNIIRKATNLFGDLDNLARHRGKNIDEDLTPQKNINLDVLGIGSRSTTFAKRHDLNMIGMFDELGDKPGFEDILPIARMIIEGYLEKKYDKIVVIYTDYKSSLVQETKVRQLLPVSETELDKMLEDLGGRSDKEKNIEERNEEFPIENYLFEPSIDVIIEHVIPRLVEIQLYQSILESSASEHSARMVSMKNASEAADDMIKDLSLIFNKARQASITQEIAEIAGGAAALE